MTRQRVLQIDTDTGATTYKFDSKAIESEPGGNNVQIKQVMLQLPDAAQELRRTREKPEAEISPATLSKRSGCRGANIKTALAWCFKTSLKAASKISSSPGVVLPQTMAGASFANARRRSTVSAVVVVGRMSNFKFPLTCILWSSAPIA